MAVRLFVLAQYRKPIDFTDEAVFSANNGWNTKEGLLLLPVRFLAVGKRSRGERSEASVSPPSLPYPYSQKLWSAFKRQDDDLNFRVG